jgi:hypothetical protein|nr:MAG TPA: hypothetical protein [Bacteriophage sp.]
MYCYKGAINLKWCVVEDFSTTKMTEALIVCDSKEDALKEAKYRWEHLTEQEKKSCDSFAVVLCNVNESQFGGEHWAEDEQGNVDSDWYEVAKQYK